MNPRDKVLAALKEGQTIRTGPASCAKYSVNDIRGLIYKMRKKYPEIKSRYVRVKVNGSTRVVANYIWGDK